MEEARYWLRHPRLARHLGPFSVADLRQAHADGTAPADSYVLEHKGQDQLARLSSTAWFPMARLLGLPEPKSPSQPWRSSPPSPSSYAIERRTQLRDQTAYPGLRTLISVTAFVTLLAIAFYFLVAVTALDRSRLGVLIATPIEVLATLCTAGMLQALLDIADSAVRRHPDTDPEPNPT